MVPIYVKTVYSFLSSTITIDNLIAFGKKHHFTTLCICDDNMYGVMEFIRKCQDNMIKPIVGLDCQECLLYAKNYQGYLHLLKLTTIKSERELEFSDYQKYASDLVCFTKKKEDYVKLKDIFNSCYLMSDFSLHQTLCLTKEELPTLKYLLMLRDGRTLSDEYTFDENVYYQENNDARITELLNECHLVLPKYNLNLPDFSKYHDLKGMTSEQYLRQLSIAGLTKRLNNQVTLKYRDRLLYELDIIEKMGFANYFLIVYDFVKYAKKQNILVGPGRGSAAGSLVSFSLGIVEVDPIKYELLFERFLNPERVQLPDIDIDFPDDRRDEVISYVKKTYGEKNVSQVISFDTFGSKMAIRDMGRVMNVPSYMIDDLNQKLGSKNLLEAEKDIKIQELLNSDNKLKELYQVAKTIEGNPRHSSVHASGVLISNQELDNIVPLIKNNDNYICGYEKDYLENLGLLKFDFLSLKNLSIITKILALIEEKKKEKIAFHQIPLNDNKTYQLFSNGDTLGIFQFEKDGMRSFLRKLKPENFLDIYNANAFYRPGPSDMIPIYIKRRHHLEPIKYLDSRLENILKSTMGIIVYQEQIMMIASTMASFRMGDADNLRRAIAKKKKDDLLKYQDEFMKKALQNGYQKEVVQKIYQDILQFAGYGFNKSHSVAYSLISYKMAYLKANYPLYFYTIILEDEKSDDKKLMAYLKELKKKNIQVIKPDINKSGKHFKLYYNHLLLPLSLIKGINNLFINKVMEVRDKEFSDIYDFMAKILPADKSILLKLIYSGCLDCFGYNRRTIYMNLDSLVNYGMVVQDLGTSNVLKPEINIQDEFSKEELISQEKDIYGFYLSNHPITYYKEKVLNNVNIVDIPKYFNKHITSVLMIDAIKEINTKNGQKMAFIACSDEEANIEIIVFPKVYEKVPNLEKNAIIRVEGRVERNSDYQIVVNSIINMKEKL